MEWSIQDIARSAGTTSRTLRHYGAVGLLEPSRGERLMAEEVFDGFDHTKYEKEVTEKWGAEAYRKGDQWWSSLSDEDKKAHQQEQLDIGAAFGQAHAAGLAVDGDDVQAITQRLYRWLRPAVSKVSKGYFTGLGQLYVDDPRYGAYDEKHGPGTAEFIRDAMKIYAERNLGD